MKTKYLFKDGELCVAQYAFFGLLHKEDEDKTINLTKVEYIEKVPIYSWFGKKFGVEFVTKDADSLYIPNKTEAEVDVLIEKALAEGATQKAHTLKFNPSEKSMKKLYKGYCMVCDEGDYIAKKVYTKDACSREIVTSSRIGYIDNIKVKYSWVDSKWGKCVVSTLGWISSVVKNIDDKFSKYYSVELTERPVGRYSNATVYIPYLSESEATKLTESIMALSTEKPLERKIKYVPSEKSMYKISKGYTIVVDEFDYMVKKTYRLADCENQRVCIEDIEYFDNIKDKNIKGLAFGTIAAGGEANTIEIFGLNMEDTTAMTDMILAKNAHLAPSAADYYKSVFPLTMPKRWIRRREHLYITNIGIVHKQYHVNIGGRIFNTRTSIVLYDKIKGYDHTGFLFKNINIYGNTTIQTIESFNFWVKTAIWRKFDELGIKNNMGDTFRASLMHRRHNTTISVGIENVVARKDKTSNVLPYANIYSCEFEKPHWYSFFGDLTIKGRRVDARAGEGGDVEMIITHMFFAKGKRAKDQIDFNIKKNN